MRARIDGTAASRQLFAWVARCRTPGKGNERYVCLSVGPDVAAFKCLMPKKGAVLPAESRHPPGPDHIATLRQAIAKSARSGLRRKPDISAV